MHESANKQQFPELDAAVKERDLPFPLVAVNGTVRLAGSAHFMQVLPLVEKVLQEAGVSVPEPQS